jgi:predicted metal-binding protein
MRPKFAISIWVGSCGCCHVCEGRSSELPLMRIYPQQGMQVLLKEAQHKPMNG